MSIQPSNHFERFPFLSKWDSKNLLVYPAIAIGAVAALKIYRVADRWTKEQKYDKSLSNWVLNSPEPNERRDLAKKIISICNDSLKTSRPSLYTDLGTAQNPRKELSLDISGLGLTSIPPLKNPRQLRVLIAPYNQFTHRVSIAVFRNLRILDLSNCGLEFYPELAGLEKLSSINFSNNRLVDSPTFKFLGNLSSLDLSNNYLSEFPEVNEIKILNLEGNNIKEIPPEILKWPPYCFVDLRGNPLSPECKIEIREAKEKGEGPTILCDPETYNSPVKKKPPTVNYADQGLPHKMTVRNALGFVVRALCWR